MPKISDEEIFKEIKKGIRSSLYFLYGEEIHFKQECATRILSASGVTMPEMNLLKLDGAKLSVDALADAAEALPMMSERRVILVRGFDVTSLSPADNELFMQVIADLPETTLLILVTADDVLDFKKKGKNETDARWTKFLNAAQKVGICCAFQYKDEATLARAIVSRARAAFKSMDMETARAMTARCPQSWSVLSNEVDKLIFFVGDRKEITKADVERCCIRSVSASAFDMAKGLLQKNFDLAFSLIDDLFYDRQNAITIVSALAMTMSDLYRAKVLYAAGGNAAKLKTDFAYGKRGFAADNAFRNIGRFSLYDVHICMKELYDADVLLKSSALDERLVLEQAIGRMKALMEEKSHA